MNDFIQRDSGITDHGSFQCNASGEEVPEIWKCDGILDCFDSEDEDDLSCDTDSSDYIRLISNDASNINTNCDSNGLEIQLENNKTYLFSHHNFPDQYGPNIECGWLFNAPDGYNVKIDLINFLLPDKRGCMADSFQLYDGRTIQSERIGSFCQLPEYIPLSLRQVFIYNANIVQLFGFFKVEHFKNIIQDQLLTICWLSSNQIARDLEIFFI